MFATKNDLGAGTRVAMTTLLNARLADAIDLHTPCKQAHWNVKDPVDLFTEISRGTDKWLWMVEAHLPRSLQPVTHGGHAGFTGDRYQSAERRRDADPTERNGTRGGTRRAPRVR